MRFVPPALAFLVRGQRALAPYLRQRCVFDDFLARALLEPLGLSCPMPETYLAQALGCMATAPDAMAAQPLEDEQAQVASLASSASSEAPAETSILM